MEIVGIRKLKENLSHYLKKVNSGERIIIKDREKEIAVIIPRIIEAEDEKIFQLVQHGIAYWAGGKPTGIPMRITSKGGKVSDAILEDRR